jgi:hypothetical protein
LQHKREAQDRGRNSFRPLLHQQAHQRRLKGHMRNREFVSTATRSCGRLSGASRPRSTKNGLYVSSYTGFWMRLSENFYSISTWVNKGKNGWGLQETPDRSVSGAPVRL